MSRYYDNEDAGDLSSFIEADRPRKETAECSTCEDVFERYTGDDDYCSRRCRERGENLRLFNEAREAALKHHFAVAINRIRQLRSVAAANGAGIDEQSRFWALITIFDDMAYTENLTDDVIESALRELKALLVLE